MKIGYHADGEPFVIIWEAGDLATLLVEEPGPFGTGKAGIGAGSPWGFGGVRDHPARRLFAAALGGAAQPVRAAGAADDGLRSARPAAQPGPPPGPAAGRPAHAEGQAGRWV
ncbi:hypothetical protein ACFQU2_13130 [Siccirubricoccus deserti]